MRILLDECVHAGVKAAFPGHSVKTVPEIGWRTSKDGPLLAFAQNHFDVFVTVDRHLGRGRNLRELKLGVVLARIANSRLESYLPIFGELLKAAERVRPGDVVEVAGPK